MGRSDQPVAAPVNLASQKPVCMISQEVVTLYGW